MINLLLDTHAFIWFMEDNPLLSRNAKRAIENSLNNVFISIASLYEIAIKLKGGKIGFYKPISAFFNDISEYNLTLLPITEKHLIAYDNIPLILGHKDPFDRLLIATAITDDLSIVSVDNQFNQYKDFVSILW